MQIQRILANDILFMSLRSSTLHINRSFFLLANGCHFNNKSLFSVNPKYRVNDDKLINHLWSTYQQTFSTQYKRQCLQKLSQFLKCDIAEAEKLFHNDEELFTKNFKDTCDKIEFLLDKNIEPQYILLNTWILKLSYPDLKSRFNSMVSWGVDGTLVQEFLPLFQLSYVEFFLVSRKFTIEKEMVPYGNRVIYLSKLLDCPVSQVCVNILKTKRIFSINYYHLKLKLDIFMSYGLDKFEILRDMYCLTSSISTIHRRLDMAKKMGIFPLKTWFVRCKEELLKRALEYQEMESSDRYILGPFKNKKDYIMVKTGLQASEIDSLRIQKLESIRNKKLKDCIDFFLDCGMDKKHILSLLTPCTLNRNFDVIKARVLQLQRLDVKNPPEWLLSANEKKYKNKIDKITSLR